MKNQKMTREQLVDELGEMRHPVSKLEKNETMRKLSRETLVDSEERFRQIVERTSDMLYRQNINTVKFEYVSPKVIDILGFTPQEMKDMDLEEQIIRIHPDDLPNVIDFSKDLVEADNMGTASIEREFRLMHKSGEYRWIHGNNNLTRDANGEPEFIVGALQDITEPKRAEQALRESEEKYRTLFERESDAIFIYDPSTTNIIDANETTSKMYGYDKDELIGMLCLKFSAEVEESTSSIDRILEDGKVSVPIRYHRKKNGIVFPVDVSGYGVKIGDKDLMFAVSKDISERLRDEENLKEEYRLRKALLDTIPGCIALILKKGSRKIVASNKFARELGAVPGQTCYKTCAQRADNCPFCLAPILWKTGQPQRLEVEYRGTWYEGIWEPLSEDLYAHYIFDISERKRSEEALKEYSDRLEDKVEERTHELQKAQEKLIRYERLTVLGELAGGMGHELRNPLGVISNAVYYLNMVLPDADEEVGEYLDLIQANTQEAAGIVGDLLDFARIKSVERSPVNLSEIVAGVLTQKSVPYNVSINVDIPKHLPPVFVDPLQISQVLVNLVTNAYQAMPDGGELTIESGEVSLDNSDNPIIALRIWDTGSGISPENMDKIFEPLFTTKARGIGLGLAISKKLVEANGGQIEVESTLGVSSTFTINLPVSE